MHFTFAAAALAALATATTVKANSFAMTPMVIKAAQENGCRLPGTFNIQNLTGQSYAATTTTTTTGNNDTAGPAWITFKYSDKTTKVETLCQFNASSKSTTPSNLAPRFACENRDVKFIWQPAAESLLTMVERVCHDSQGTPGSEVSGSINVSMSCQSGHCVANTTDYQVKFVSLEPVGDPTRLKMALQRLRLNA